MHKTIIAGLAGLAAAQVLANSFGLKPGLWETRIVKMVVDGQDKTSMMSDAASKMQAAMANMPPEQRERMEAMMKERGGPSMGGDGTTRICVSPELASQEKPFTGKDEHCQPVSMTHAGNRTSYTVNCSFNGDTTTGKGEATTAGDLISTKMDMTSKKASGETHQRHIETEMKFLGADCGGVQPIMPPKAGQ